MNTEDINDLIARISSGNFTDEEITQLKSALQNNSSEMVTSGKYNTAISDAKDIHLGDSFIPEIRDEVTQKLNQAIQESKFIIRRTTRTGRGFIEPLLEVGNALPLHMVLVPSGIFTMGSPEDEPEREEREGPQHQVTVSSFFMSRHPVTQAQYEQAMESNPATQYDTDRFVAPDKPVVGVSWHNAVDFCQRLAQLTDRPYRLPTEAEWEYACRAGTKTPFYFGKTLTTKVANHDGNYTYANGPKGESRNETTPVNHFGIANAFGLSDMHGNVYEWCQDYGHDDYNNAPTNGSAWTEGGDESLRILRGGSWVSSPGKCRSAYRNGGESGLIYDIVGFRVVCTVPRTL